MDGDEQHKMYRYGGAWKNKWAGVSAKMPRKAKGKGPKGGRKNEVEGTGETSGGPDIVEDGEGEQDDEGTEEEQRV